MRYDCAEHSTLHCSFTLIASHICDTQPSSLTLVILLRFCVYLYTGAKNDAREYEDLDSFMHDVNLILQNAKAYNSNSTEQGAEIIARAHAFVRFLSCLFRPVLFSPQSREGQTSTSQWSARDVLTEMCLRCTHHTTLLVSALLCSIGLVSCATGGLRGAEG